MLFFADGNPLLGYGSTIKLDYAASPLRALDNDLGVRAPVGFWDPTGFNADGNAENLERRRQAELKLKRGRIATLAMRGYITREIIKQMPGFLQPAVGLNSADIPNGRAATSKVLGASWAQTAAYAAHCEVSQDKSVLTSSDPLVKQKRPAAELAFRRLATMTIVGTFFQNGLTGSAWGDWATFTASPVRALDKDLGVRAPVGFRDPICFTTDGNVENFNLRRLADGSSESAWGDRDSFTASPLRAFKSEPSMQATAGFWNPTGFTADGSVETIKLDTELANGRLATIAILSMVCSKRVRSNRLGVIGAASRPRL
jgi:hypothetical protein